MLVELVSLVIWFRECNMTEKLDIERRLRIQEWFKSDPEIWLDIADEIKISYNNELNQIKSRTCTNREWSAGYVYGYGELLDLERYFKKVWNPPTTIKI